MRRDKIPTIDEITGIEVTYSMGVFASNKGFTQRLDFRTGEVVYVKNDPFDHRKMTGKMRNMEIVDDIRQTIAESGLLEEEHRYDGCFDGRWEYITLLTDSGEYHIEHFCAMPSRKGFDAVFKKVKDVSWSPIDS